MAAPSKPAPDTEALSSALAALIRIVAKIEAIRAIHPGDARTIFVQQLGCSQADFDAIEAFAAAHPPGR